MITHLPILEEIFFIQTGQQRPEGINDVTFVKTKVVSVAYGTGEKGFMGSSPRCEGAIHHPEQNQRYSSKVETPLWGV